MRVYHAKCISPSEECECFMAFAPRAPTSAKVSACVFLDAQKNKLKEGKVVKFDVLPNRHYFMVLLIFSFCQITSNFVYYGLLWNAGSLSGSVHVNSAINGVMATIGSLLQSKKS